MTHTKGKWRLGTHTNIIFSDEATEVCQYNREIKEGKANARLIASAPELLEALKALVNAENVEQEAIAIGNAAEAIKKAEG